MFVYKLDVIKELKNCGYSTYKIQMENLLACSSLNKLKNNEMVGINVLDTICNLTGRRIEEIIEHVKD